MSFVSPVEQTTVAESLVVERISGLRSLFISELAESIEMTDLVFIMNLAYKSKQRLEHHAVGEDL
jgi:hypothetical protein